MSGKGKRGLVAHVFRGHAIAPEVRKEWGKMTRQVNGDLEALRRGLAGTSSDLTVPQEQLLVSFANAALTERVLNAQAAYWLQYVQDLQAKGEDSTTPLHNALKVITTAKGPSYQKLLVLREIESQTKEEAEAEALPSLKEYMAQGETKTQATLSRKKSGPEATVRKGTGRTEEARFPDSGETSGNTE